MVNTYGEELERKIREDNETKKLYDYDLIVDVQKRYDENQVKIKLIEQTQILMAK